MNSAPLLRIGTRKSELATWQAKRVAELLTENGCRTELVFITSEGDIDQSTPLTEMGGKGVFTKALDDALISEEIDLAVHSYKDLPTEHPLPLEVSAVVERADPRDCLVARAGFPDGPEAIIATSSNRRRSQWLNRFPGHEMTNIRGNVNTRLRKIEENGWDGAIFAAAGLTRIGLEGHITRYLDWMVPAPAQGAMAVVTREGDRATRRIVSRLNDETVARCTRMEREFLNEMEAGCSAPVGALAEMKGDSIDFKAVALTLDGGKRFYYEELISLAETGDKGREVARLLLKRGADRVMDELNSDEG